MKNFFILIFTIVIGCRMNESKNIIINMLSRPLNEITNLSDIAFDVKYIPLQTIENSLIRYTNGLKTGNDKFYIYTINEILCFNKSGDYLYKLDKIGRGPEEYILIHDFDISPKNNLLIIKVERRIIIYKEENDGFIYLKTLNFKFPPDKISFSPDQNSILLSYSASYGYEPFRNVLIDLNGDTIIARTNYYKYIKSEENRMIAFAYDNINFKFNDKLCFKEMFSDTVFTLDPSNRILPYLILNSDGKGPTAPYMADVGNVFNNYDKYIHLYNIMEVSRYIIYSFSYKKVEQLAIYDKSINKKSEINARIFLKDDITGGVNFEPKFCSEGKLYSWVDALTLKKYVASEDFAKARVQDPKKKEELKALAENLNETDNPVLIIVTPKK